MAERGDMRIFVICPVREITDKEHRDIEHYVAQLEASGATVHWPERDTNQNDACGLAICEQNRKAIVDAEEIHIWWKPSSKGSLFDCGIAFGLGKRIRLANPHQVQQTPEKSFENVLRELHDRACISDLHMDHIVECARHEVPLRDAEARAC